MVFFSSFLLSQNWTLSVQEGGLLAGEKEKEAFGFFFVFFFDFLIDINSFFVVFFFFFVHWANPWSLASCLCLTNLSLSIHKAAPSFGSFA